MESPPLCAAFSTPPNMLFRFLEEAFPKPKSRSLVGSLSSSSLSRRMFLRWRKNKTTTATTTGILHQLASPSGTDNFFGFQNKSKVTYMIPRTIASVASDVPTGFSQVLEASVETQLPLRSRDPMDSRLRRRFIRDPIPEICASRATSPAVAGLTPRARMKLIFPVPPNRNKF